MTKELQDPEISRTIAARLADYHQLHMPMTKDPRLLDQFTGYFNKAKSLGVNMAPYIAQFQHCCELFKNFQIAYTFLPQ